MTAVDYATQHGLSRVGARLPLPAYLGQLWRRRAFTWALASNRVRAQAQQQRLGLLWTGIQPLILAGVYLVVFGCVLGLGDTLPGEAPINYPAYLVVGVFTFQYLAHSMSGGAKSISKNKALVRGLAFPRAVLPLAATLQQFLLLLPAIAVMVVLVTVIGEPVRPEWALLVPAFALQSLFCAGLALLLARAAAASSDLLQLLPLATRFWMYLSGVFWTVERLRSRQVPDFVISIFEYNPGHVFLSLTRHALIEELPPTPFNPWLPATVWAIAVFAIGLIVFWRAEEQYTRD